MIPWPFFASGPPLCAAATLATLARDAAEDIFDGLTTDCTEPHRLEREDTMGRLTTERNARAAQVLAAQGSPLVCEHGQLRRSCDARDAHAPAPAPAPAADVATGERTHVPDWRARALEAEARFDSADAELGRTYHDLDAAILRAEAAEAERDRLALEGAAVEAELSRSREMEDFNLCQFEAAHMDWDDARRECRRLAAENAALRGAMPDAQDLHLAAQAFQGGDYRRKTLESAAARIRALSATPPAAEAVTGGEDAPAVWGREAPTEPGLYWAMRRYDKKPVQARFTYRGGPAGRWIRIAVAGAGSYGQSEFALFGPRVTPPDGWTQDQEATDAGL